MVQVPRRPTFADSALVRLLARWNDAQVREPAASTAERLSQWLAWTDAIALSTVLNAPAVRAKAVAGTPDAECARVRDGLAKTLCDSTAARLQELLALTIEDLASALAVLVAETLDATHSGAHSEDHRIQLASDQLATALGLDMRCWWNPTEAFWYG